MPSLKPLVGIIMGSDSDLPVMREAAEVLEELGVTYELTIVSAHRTPERMFTYAREAGGRGIRVIIAGAGGAAHLPGMTASVTPLPVIGVPVKSSNSIDGWDSILSILQMPNGVPVATVALNAARNAGILAAQMLSTSDDELTKRIISYKEKLKLKVLDAAQRVEQAAESAQASGNHGGNAGDIGSRKPGRSQG
ncbi:MAG: 5-(carboxyamino)imidazole ribonucleotide mutase [Bacteroidota bacterium]